MSKFDTITDTQGRRVASLSIPELTALQVRCHAHQAECERRGIAVRRDISLICAATEYFCNVSNGPIAEAFRRFSELSNECKRHGYVVPSISGTPRAGQIMAICNLLEQTIAASNPLPGEPPELTHKISADYGMAIKNAIDTLNELTTGA